ncbi:hypothetical protein P170DRAFT_470583 [Aspergillus steynii IBT 23096]|uniref:Uncharacterized protein n=1 Tax=Aspergillus steynii IBT 23096 TaxID=1392250 RepID=A0A2I2GQL0_9EURO|nr:uncharacterized protein P170DRAFT_470583 [Aspergillus steynii IBT 23096]PLB55167.1 hypothetical protein P170DRAFT_470583 [Aspergillus steynii IBT 23096]
MTPHESQEVQEQLKRESLALCEENKYLKSRLDASDQARSVNGETIRQLKSVVVRCRGDNLRLQRRAKEVYRKHLIDSTRIRDLEKQIKDHYRDHENLQNQEKARQLLDATKIQRLETEATKHRQDNQLLREQMEDRHSLDSEKIRQLTSLLDQAREEAGKTEEAHRGKLYELYNMINSLQIGPAQLNDEQITQRMREVGHDLDSWIRLNFKDNQKPATLAQKESGSQFPCNSLQLQAWIQGSVTQLIHDHILAPRHFGLVNNSLGRFIDDLKEGIKKNHSDERALRTWQAITCDFIDVATKHDREYIIQWIVNINEEHFKML